MSEVSYAFNIKFLIPPKEDKASLTSCVKGQIFNFMDRKSQNFFYIEFSRFKSKFKAFNKYYFFFFFLDFPFVFWTTISLFFELQPLPL